jgi:hypothetical protein
VDGIGFAVLATEYDGEPGMGGRALSEGDGGFVVMMLLCWYVFVSGLFIFGSLMGGERIS